LKKEESMMVVPWWRPQGVGLVAERLNGAFFASLLLKVFCLLLFLTSFSGKQE
jgi:hypothetical protein